MTLTVTPDPDPAPELLRGSLFMLRRKCGKPGCHCATGDPHETPALAYPAGGRTSTLTLRPEDVAVVEAALARYQQARKALDDDADAGVSALRAHAQARRSRAGRR